MSDRTYRVIEVVGTSTDGVDSALRNGVKRAGETMRHLDWFEVVEIRGHITDGEPDGVVDPAAFQHGGRCRDSRLPSGNR